MADAPRLTQDDGADVNRPVLLARKTPSVTDLPLGTVGQDLCKARQRRGKELSDVWLALKISPAQLTAIEEDRFDALPGRVYAIGYVRSYAAYLGLDAANFVDRLKVELAARCPAPEPAIDPLPVPERRPLHGGIMISGLLLVAVIYSGYSVFASVGRKFDHAVMPVPPRLAAEAGLTEQPITKPSPAPVGRPAPPRQATLSPLPEITLTPPLSVRAELLPATIQPPLPPGRRYGAQNRNSRITLKAHRAIHLAVRGTRNRVFIDRPLAPGDTYRVPDLVGLRLSVSDAGAVEVILDGSSFGFAGDNGKTATSVSLNPQAIVDRQQQG